MTKQNGDSQNFIKLALYVACACAILTFVTCFYFITKEKTIAEEITLILLYLIVAFIGWMATWSFYLSMVDKHIIAELDNAKAHPETTVKDPKFLIKLNADSLTLISTLDRAEITIPANQLVEFAYCSFGGLLRSRKPGGDPKKDLLAPIDFSLINLTELLNWLNDRKILIVQERKEFQILRKIFRNSELLTRLKNQSSSQS